MMNDIVTNPCLRASRRNNTRAISGFSNFDEIANRPRKILDKGSGFCYYTNHTLIDSECKCKGAGYLI